MALNQKIQKSNCVIKLLRDTRFPVSQCWNQIGNDLGVPLEERRRFRQVANVHFDYWAALEECIEWWLRNDPEPTWGNLLLVIQESDMRAADAIRQELSRGLPHKIECAEELNRTQHSNGSDRRRPLVAGPQLVNKDIGSKWHCLFKMALLPALVLVCAIVMYTSGPIVWAVSAAVPTLLLCLWCKHEGNKSYEVVSQKAKKPKPDHINRDDPEVESRIWEPGETGDFVVEKCIEKLQLLKEAEVFPDDKNFMERLAFLMSRNGNASFTLHNDGGIWQVSQYAFMDTKDELGHIRLPKKYQKLKDFLGIEDWRKVTRCDLEKPMYSALAARLYLSNFAEAIPPSFNIEKQQEYWWRFYMREHEAKKHMSETDFMNAFKVMNR